MCSEIPETDPCDCYESILEISSSIMPDPCALIMCGEEDVVQNCQCIKENSDGSIAIIPGIGGPFITLDFNPKLLLNLNDRDILEE